MGFSNETRRAIRQATMSDRPNVITILNSRLPVDFLSQDVAIVFHCCCSHCQREKGVVDDLFDVAAAAEDQRLVAGISDMFYRWQLD